MAEIVMSAAAEAPPPECGNPIIRKFAAEVYSELLSWYRRGFRIIVNVEPRLYESSASILSMAHYCLKLAEDEHIVEVFGAQRNVKFVLNNVRIVTSNDTLIVRFVITTAEDVIRDILNRAMSSPNELVLFHLRSPPAAILSSSVEVRGLVGTKIESILSQHEKYRERVRYIGRLPYETIILADDESLREAAATWQPPPPPRSTYLEKQRLPLDRLVLSREVKERIKLAMDSFAARGGRGTLLVIGLFGSGRKTIAASIAHHYERPAYHFAVHNILSRWLGESEKFMKAFFEGVRSTADSVVVIEGVDSLYKRVSSDGTGSNLRQILINELAREDNNYIAVLLADQSAKSDMIFNPVLGEMKIVVPPPTLAQRRELLRRFIAMVYEPVKDRVERRLREHGIMDIYSYYVPALAPATAGMTPGEIWRVVVLGYILPALHSVADGGKPVKVDKILKMLMPYNPVRMAELERLKELALRLGQRDVVQQIERVQNELKAKAVERGQVELEEY